MRTMRYLPVIAVATLLGACASPAPLDLNTAEVRALPQKGTAFQQALSQDYVTLAQTEADESHNVSASYYNIKARQSAAGVVVMPTSLTKRSLPDAHIQELTNARAELMRVIDAGGGSKAPLQTARAQTQFDCWVEEQTENFQPDDIALCKNGFLNALNQSSKVTFAEAPPAPAAPAVAAPVAMPNTATYTLYFDHNESMLNEAARATKDEIVAAIRSMNATSVMVNGYTDRSGEQAYNSKLAERRAASVAEAIETAGVKPYVGSESFGEDRSAVATADDVREWKNRRVIVTLKK